jgi:hypothetical protein
MAARYAQVCIVVWLCVLVPVPGARAGWDPADGHVMHWAQTPDPDGYGVMTTAPRILADDFACTRSGPITGIYFWGSWAGDQAGLITAVHLSIHADNATGAIHKPGTVLWMWDTATFDSAPVNPPSLQGWFDPMTEGYSSADHWNQFSYSIDGFTTPFQQVKGSVYWLAIQVTAAGGSWGRTTSGDASFGARAVWANWNPMLPVEPQWAPLTDPAIGRPLDLAFVITPEPGTLALAAVGACGALVRRRRRSA